MGRQHSFGQLSSGIVRHSYGTRIATDRWRRIILCCLIRERINSMSQPIIPPEVEQKIRDSQQSVGREPDGPGKRIGKVGEFTFIAPVKSGGGEKFRQHLAASQAHAGYYEGQLGTVHDLRIVLFDNDTRLL